MNNLKSIVIVSLVYFCLIGTVCAQTSSSIKDLVSKGKALIESGKYQDAANCLGEILSASGNFSSDPEVDALGATVQAYGMWKTGDSRMLVMAKNYLKRAIDHDPKWAYPKKLLDDISRQ